MMFQRKSHVKLLEEVRELPLVSEHFLNKMVISQCFDDKILEAKNFMKEIF